MTEKVAKHEVVPEAAREWAREIVGKIKNNMALEQQIAQVDGMDDTEDTINMYWGFVLRNLKSAGYEVGDAPPEKRVNPLLRSQPVPEAVEDVAEEKPIAKAKPKKAKKASASNGAPKMFGNSMLPFSEVSYSGRVSSTILRADSIRRFAIVDGFVSLLLGHGVVVFVKETEAEVEAIRAGGKETYLEQHGLEETYITLDPPPEVEIRTKNPAFIRVTEILAPGVYAPHRVRVDSIQGVGSCAGGRILERSCGLPIMICETEDEIFSVIDDEGILDL